MKQTNVYSVSQIQFGTFEPLGSLVPKLCSTYEKAVDFTRTTCVEHNINKYIDNVKCISCTYNKDSEVWSETPVDITDDLLFDNYQNCPIILEIPID